MKKIKLLALIAVLSFSTVSVISCSSDDSTPVNQQASIEGKWYFSKYGVSISNVEQLDNYQHTTGCTKDHIDAVAGGEYNENRYVGGECQLLEENGTWVREGNNIKVTIGEMETVYEIVSLTNSELKVRSLETFEGQSYYEVIVFTRN